MTVGQFINKCALGLAIIKDLNPDYKGKETEYVRNICIPSHFVMLQTIQSVTVDDKKNVIINVDSSIYNSPDLWDKELIVKQIREFKTDLPLQIYERSAIHGNTTLSIDYDRRFDEESVEKIYVSHNALCCEIRHY